MGDAVELEVAGRTVRLSSPDKVFFPERGYTKLDVARYYQAVAPASSAPCATAPPPSSATRTA